MDQASPAKPRAKLVPIQALRAVAALTVAVVHLVFGFARHLDARLAAMPIGDQLAQAAVALFFIISGCVMVISSEGLFGSMRGSVTFWRRRAVRVLPPYWIATAIMAAAMAALGQQVDYAYAARSLAFVPAPAPDALFRLYLWPGWTLLYELVFYALFGAFVALGRRGAVAATGAILVAFIVFGLSGTGNLALVIVSRPIVLLFVAGMLAGLALLRGHAAPAWMRWIAIVLAAALFLAPPAHQHSSLGFDYLVWAGLPAALMFFAVMGGAMKLPFAAALEALGGASYAIYLLHVPFAHLWMRAFNSWLGHPGGSLGYLALGIPLLVALSIAFHRGIEVPLTDRLNRVLGGPRVYTGGINRTLAP
jgi:exopolysaccharide production protein ExoZ